MKKLIVFAMAFAFVGIGASAQAQEKSGAAPVKLPDAVVKAIKANCPNAEIASAELEKEAGLNLYDIEFKAGRGEIEVAEDGTVMDIATIVALKDLPAAAAAAIRKAAAGAEIKQVEKSEIRAEINKTGAAGTIVKLASPKYVYEAEMAKAGQRGEVQVSPEGRIVEGPKWAAVKEKEEEEGEESEANEEKEAKPSTPDLKILPPAVLNAFKAAYPNAVIKGTSKETEKGLTYYEVESVDGKVNRDLLYTADGKAAEIEETVAPESLPQAVQKSLAAKFPGFTILKAEAMTKGERKLFELQIQVNGKKRGVTIDPAGKIIE